MTRTDTVRTSDRIFARFRKSGGWMPAFAACLGAGLILAGPQAALAETPQVGGTLRAAWVGGGAADKLDPTTWLTVLELARISAVFDRLTKINENGKPELMLAQAMTPNADASVWTVKLHPGVKFHDGTPLTSKDVLYSFRSAVGRGYFAATNFSMINLDKSRAVDDLTVEFVLNAPNAEFDRVVSDASASIIKDGTTDFSTTAIGTGPYKIVNWVPGVRTELARNEAYWGSRVALDELDMIEIDDDNARINALLSGQIDLAVNVPPYFATQLEGASGYSVAYGSGSTAPAFYMRQDKAPFDKAEVRQALRLAIDRKKCVEVALDGRGAVGNDLFGPSHPSYARDIPQREYDPEAARKLLDKAGIGELQVELVTAPGVGMLECATVFKESAKKAGIDISIRQISPADLYNTQSVYLQVPFGTTEWKGVSFQEMARTGLLQSSFANETANKKPAFDAAFAKAEAELDATARNQQFAALQRTLWDDGGYIVWGIQTPVTAFSDRVQGYQALAGAEVGFLPSGLGDLWIKH